LIGLMWIGLVLGGLEWIGLILIGLVLGWLGLSRLALGWLTLGGGRRGAGPVHSWLRAMRAGSAVGARAARRSVGVAAAVGVAGAVRRRMVRSALIARVARLLGLLIARIP
jgi:hypothetical protein